VLINRKWYVGYNFKYRNPVKRTFDGHRQSHMLNKC